MTKLEVLKLLRELVENSRVSMGLHTGIQKDVIDYRFLLKSIEDAAKHP